MRRQNVTPRHDAAIARLADAQSGIVARAQLQSIGVAPSAIDRRLRSGRLAVLHRGVYAVGHRHVQRRGRLLAAVLAAGPGALLSHRAAAALWDLRRSGDERIDVTRPGRSGDGSPPGIRLHRTRALDASDISSRDGIPCTSVARTLLDLAGAASARELERACERAEALGVFDLRAVESALARANGRRGAGALRELLACWTASCTLTRSELEERFLALLRAAGLPQPRLNATVLVDGGARHVEVDALWPEQRLIVELDGHASHGTRAAFERDRVRDIALMRAGYRVARLTWRQVTGNPSQIARAIADLLGA